MSDTQKAPDNATGEQRFAYKESLLYRCSNCNAEQWTRYAGGIIPIHVTCPLCNQRTLSRAPGIRPEGGYLEPGDFFWQGECLLQYRPLGGNAVIARELCSYCGGSSGIGHSSTCKLAALADGEPLEGLSIICGHCGNLVGGEEAGERVRWVKCNTCRLTEQRKAPASEAGGASESPDDVCGVLVGYGYKCGVQRSKHLHGHDFVKEHPVVDALRAQHRGDWWKHPTLVKARELCDLIEALPAHEDQTRLSGFASAAAHALQGFLKDGSYFWPQRGPIYFDAPATGPCANCGAITRLPPGSDGHFCGAPALQAPVQRKNRVCEWCQMEILDKACIVARHPLADAHFHVRCYWSEHGENSDLDVEVLEEVRSPQAFEAAKEPTVTVAPAHTPPPALRRNHVAMINNRATVEIRAGDRVRSICDTQDIAASQDIGAWLGIENGATGVVADVNFGRALPYLVTLDRGGDWYFAGAEIELVEAACSEGRGSA